MLDSERPGAREHSVIAAGAASRYARAMQFPLLARDVLAALAAALLASGVAAQESSRSAIVLHPLLQDGAVLLRDATVPLSGDAGRPGAEVAVRASWDGLRRVVRADDRGRFRCDVATPPSGGPFELAFETAGRSVVVRDVLVGEVWLCSGQSNMDWKLEQGVDGATEALQAPDLARVRHFRVGREPAAAPADRCRGAWVAGSRETAARFTAVGFFFARALRDALGDVPIGLVDAAYGGTPAEAWTSAETLRALGDADLQPRANDRSPQAPAALFHGMITPLRPAAFRGVIWYQGESNVGRADQYRRLFPALIADWRAQFGAPDLPFLFVQIAPYAYRDDAGAAAELKAAQEHAARTVSRTAMVVTADLGAADDIHPRRKDPVGRRLAACALALAYGKADVPWRSPAAKVATREGATIRVTFDDGAGLKTSDGREPAHVEVADDKGAWFPAAARIEGGTLRASSDRVPTPVAVR
jgi:sialate O-acetylesterase